MKACTREYIFNLEMCENGIRAAVFCVSNVLVQKIAVLAQRPAKPAQQLQKQNTHHVVVTAFNQETCGLEAKQAY